MWLLVSGVGEVGWLGGWWSVVVCFDTRVTRKGKGGGPVLSCLVQSVLMFLYSFLELSPINIYLFNPHNLFKVRIWDPRQPITVCRM